MNILSIISMGICNADWLRKAGSTGISPALGFEAADPDGNFKSHQGIAGKSHQGKEKKGSGWMPEARHCTKFLFHQNEGGMLSPGPKKEDTGLQILPLAHLSAATSAVLHERQQVENW